MGAVITEVHEAMDTSPSTKNAITAARATIHPRRFGGAAGAAVGAA